MVNRCFSLLLACSLAACAARSSVAEPTVARTTASQEERDGGSGTHENTAEVTEPTLTEVTVLPPRAPATVSDGTPPAPPRTPSAATSQGATARVREALESMPELSGPEAAWMPFRVLSLVAPQVRELPAPTATVTRDRRVLWSLLLAPGELTAPDDRQRLCAMLQQNETRIACAHDTVQLNGTERSRLAVGWRAAEATAQARNDVDLATPLRAFSRAGRGLCVLSIERTARTMEIEVRAPDVRVLGTVLALVAAAPRLSDLILLRSQPEAGGLHVFLSWPLDRVNRDAALLQEDAWPQRCDGHARVASELPRATPVTAIFPAQGTSARGALVSAERREWLVTEGDFVGDAEVVAVTERGVQLRRGNARRTTLVRFAARPVQAAPGQTVRAPTTPRLPLPPEPPMQLPR